MAVYCKSTLGISFKLIIEVSGYSLAKQVKKAKRLILQPSTESALGHLLSIFPSPVPLPSCHVLSCSHHD